MYTPISSANGVFISVNTVIIFWEEGQNYSQTAIWDTVEGYWLLKYEFKQQRHNYNTYSYQRIVAVKSALTIVIDPKQVLVSVVIKNKQII